MPTYQVSKYPLSFGPDKPKPEWTKMVWAEDDKALLRTIERFRLGPGVKIREVEPLELLEFETWLANRSVRAS